eukprot:1179698-Prorocentrum_minimum.AAC.2
MKMTKSDYGPKRWFPKVITAGDEKGQMRGAEERRIRPFVRCASRADAHSAWLRRGLDVLRGRIDRYDLTIKPSRRSNIQFSHQLFTDAIYMSVSSPAGGKVSSELDTVDLTVKTLSSHLVARIFNSPANSSRTTYVRVELYPPEDGRCFACILLVVV